MTPHQILIVVIRLLALLWFLFTISNAGTFYGIAEALKGMSVGPGMLWALGLVQLAACAFMWFFPATLASKLLRDGARPISSNGPIEHWQALVPIGVGLWLLARAVPDLADWLMYFVLRRHDDVLKGAPVGADEIANVLATFVETAVGAWLILSGPAVTRLLVQARLAGLRSKISDSMSTAVHENKDDVQR